MTVAKTIKCIECDCELGVIYKATLKTKAVYVCKDCYDGTSSVYDDSNNEPDINLGKMKEMFGMT